jgi:uncharacterized membrane protein YphA (DoxX/SURF4 family)
MSTTQSAPSPTPVDDKVTTASAATTDAAARWKLATRVVFRFCFVYFTLYCLYTQIIEAFVPLPFAQDWPDPSTLPPMRQVVYWTATHVFHVKTQLVNSGSGSGDKTWDWVLMFCVLVISLLAAAIWSALDRQRPNYVTLHKWFRLGLRFALASQMLGYGLAKAVPLQMPFPYLYRLLEPYGNRSRMGVLWDSIGASPGYEISAGCAEILGGILLFFPRTTLFGALVCLADMVQVFMLNMTYDVPVKLFSFHLILISLVLLAPEFRRLVSFFFGNHAVQPSSQPVIGRTQKRARIVRVLQAALGLWLLGANAYGSWKLWYQYGGGRPKSVLYGIWEIEEFSQDGNLRAALVTDNERDNERFRRAIFDFTDRMQFEKMDNTFAGYGTTIDDGKKTMTLTKSSDKNFKASFTYHRDGDQLTFDGDMDKHKLHLKLHRVDHTKFLLLSRGFHWIQEYPFNR